MLKLISSAQMHEADAFTIKSEPISSLDLMERASLAFVNYFSNHFTDKQLSIAVYCGTGNNGGDGLAIARMLFNLGYKNINVKITRFSTKTTPDFDANFNRIKEASVPVTELKPEDLPSEKADLIIDALLGSGLNKPLSGAYANLVNHLNSLEKQIVAVDIPTGFFAEGVIDAAAIILKADFVITFQQPKINFLLLESAAFMDNFAVVDIGLNKPFIQNANSFYHLVEEEDMIKTVRPRKKFQHKGSFGHALLIAGQEKTMGAALLCASACVYAGTGLTTVCMPASGLTALNTLIPEAMAILRKEQQLPEIEWNKFTVVAAGPGLGKDSKQLIETLLSSYKKPVVLDADALNMLSENPEWWNLIPENTVLTPHVKEFDRLFGQHHSWWERLQTARNQALEKKIVIILKNQYTVVASPDGNLYFNTTGNPAMSSGGMGDVLTGIIASLIAQGYPVLNACLTGVFVHGKAGDELVFKKKSAVVLAMQVAKQTPKTLAKLIANKKG